MAYSIIIVCFENWLRISEALKSWWCLLEHQNGTWWDDRCRSQHRQSFTWANNSSGGINARSGGEFLRNAHVSQCKKLANKSTPLLVKRWVKRENSESATSGRDKRARKMDKREAKEKVVFDLTGDSDWMVSCGMLTSLLQLEETSTTLRNRYLHKNDDNSFSTQIRWRTPRNLSISHSSLALLSTPIRQAPCAFGSFQSSAPLLLCEFGIFHCMRTPIRKRICKYPRNNGTSPILRYIWRTFSEACFVKLICVKKVLVGWLWTKFVYFCSLCSLSVLVLVLIIGLP